MAGVSEGTVFIDPVAGLKQRYKYVGSVRPDPRWEDSRGTDESICICYSADGIHWKGTSAMGVARVEILDETEEKIPGFTLQDCDPINGNLLHHIVSWNGRSDLSSLRGKPVGLHFVSRSTIFTHSALYPNRKAEKLGAFPTPAVARGKG